MQPSSDLNQTLISFVQPSSQPLFSTENDSANSEVDLFNDSRLYGIESINNETNDGYSVLSQLHVLSQGDFTSNINRLSQDDVTSTQLSFQDRKKLVQLCMSSGEEEDEEEENEEEGREEEDMSQPIDNDCR